MTSAHETPAPAALDAWTEHDEARLVLYHVLSLAASDPASRRRSRLHEPSVRQCVRDALDLVAARPCGALAPGERPPHTLAALSLDLLLRPSDDALRAEHDRVFGLVSSKECPPCETEWCPQTFSVYRSQALADVAGFYRAFGLQPSLDVPERHDHLALELEFMAWLLAKERHARQQGSGQAAELAGVCRDAQRGFARSHLVWWLPAFARALRLKADGPGAGGEPAEPPRTTLGTLGAALAAFVAAERAALGIEQPTELVEPRPVAESGEGCAGCGGDALPA